MGSDIQIRRILDVGSSRGNILASLAEVHPEATQLLGIEPDSRVIPQLVDERMEVVNSRFEHVDFGTATFDLITCCQTLEHADSCRAMLSGMLDLLSPDGLLFVEVPNTESIRYEANVDEFFIDKHTFHFTHNVLAKFLATLPAEVVYMSPPGDTLNISFVLRRGRGKALATEIDLKAAMRDSASVAHNRELMTTYATKLASNRALLPEAARKLEKIGSAMTTTLWGATTVLDALVRYGDLDLNLFSSVVDTYLCIHYPHQHGVTVESPDILRLSPPDAAIVLARYSAPVIEQACLDLGIRSVVLFEDVLRSCGIGKDAEHV